MKEPTEQVLRPRKRTTFRAVLAAVLGFSCAGAAAYYAWDLRTDHQEALKQLTDAQVTRDALKSKVSILASQKSEADKMVQDCSRERDQSKQSSESASKSLTDVQANLAATREELDSLRKLRAENEKRLQAFRDLTAKFQKMIDTGKLQVVVRDGKMIVKLPAGILFPSGKAELSKEGSFALMEVAVVLKQLHDRHFMVVGHTDNVPLGPQSPSPFKDNWELSTARALTVTKFLVDGGLKPTHLLAAGHAEYEPVASNRAESGRHENRRIEIVLLPNLEELPPMPEAISKKDDKEKDKAK
jgi:chemotaxis protein MotB